jgi:hypothetical protein
VIRGYRNEALLAAPRQQTVAGASAGQLAERNEMYIAALAGMPLACILHGSSNIALLNLIN